DLEENENRLDPNQVVIIEQVFILGFMADEGNKVTKMDKFHDYSGIQRVDGTFDQEQIVKAMMQKHTQRQNELNSFLCTMDNDDKQLHDVSHVDNYSIYKNTRTIMDDL